MLTKRAQKIIFPSLMQKIKYRHTHKRIHINEYTHTNQSKKTTENHIWQITAFNFGNYQ